MGRIKNSMHRNFGLMAIIAASATVLVVGMSATPARADAHNTIGFGPCYVEQQICIPRGTFTIQTSSVGGSGNQINYVDAGFTYFGQICNLWIDHNFYNASGVLVEHIQGQERYGCFSVAGQDWTFPGGYSAPAYGKHCATLYSQQPGYIKKWVTACNNIG